MKYYGTISDPKDLVTKEYVDSQAVAGGELIAVDDGNGNVTLLFQSASDADSTEY